MDYNQKKLKYKQKYLELKQQVAGSFDFIAKLKELYTTPKFDAPFTKTYNYPTTYGEMDYESMNKLSIKFNDVKHFLDIGSGRGKLCLYMAHEIKIKSSIGIELVEERHNDAIQLKQQLSPDFSIFTNKVEFINADIFGIDLIKKFKGKTLVWFSNLMFQQDISNNVIIKLINELPKDSIILCSKPFSILHDNINLLEEIIVIQSWDLNSKTYCYQII